MHPSGEYYLPFKVATGQRRVVHYIGRTYDATTPLGLFHIGLENVKGDRTTFGSTGRFFRLLENQDEMTAYGFHGHAASKYMLNDPDEERYKSMGCVITDEEMIKIIAETVRAVSGTVPVHIVAWSNGSFEDIAKQAEILLGRP